MEGREKEGGRRVRHTERQKCIRIILGSMGLHRIYMKPINRILFPNFFHNNSFYRKNFDNQCLKLFKKIIQMEFFSIVLTNLNYKKIF